MSHLFETLQTTTWGILKTTYALWLQMGIYLVFGFAVAGVLSRFLKSETIARHLGGNTFASVWKAAILGVPLPLCSCGVLPVGLSLLRRGASRGATTAFLISTPETGVDSIVVTYGMLGPLGPVFAIVRPIAAFLNGLLGGGVVSWLDHRDAHKATATSGSPSGGAPAPHADLCGSGGSCCGEAPSSSEHASFWQHLKGAFHYGFLYFPREIVKWLLIGLVAAGVIAYFLPADQRALAQYLGTGLMPMVVMALVGIPLYICATASVPFVAVLLGAGLSPGAALVFLMCGPATNSAALVMLWKMLGPRTVCVYLASIVVTSFSCGFLLDAYFAAAGGVPPIDVLHHHDLLSVWHIAGAVGLLLIVAAALWQNFQARYAKAPDAPDENLLREAGLTPEATVPAARRLRVSG
ncbi:MAG TPA: SO_0444 family Cu/Zn efflux transporter, partial [Candidatus Sumerlaeota bacterium]|nr:SO_0444 family Cu/Zn efflux transporter [Candidatus Sumerlaeota bacterium]